MRVTATPISFAPVRVAAEGSPTVASCGTIEIELSGARMRISGAVDPATLTAVLSALAGGRRR
jgi:transposase